jgi:phosphoribosylformylglycinamidine synthase
VALAECCIAGGEGARIELDAVDAAALFGEGPGAFVVSAPAEALAAFGQAATVIGTVGGDALEIAGALSVPVSQLAAAHARGLPDRLR